MKKISLAIISAAIFATPSFAESNFDGFRATVGGSALWNAGTPILTTSFKGKAPVLAIGATADPKAATIDTTKPVVVALNSFGFSRGYLDLGYSKVMSSNLLLGASAFGGYDFLKIDNTVGTAPVAGTPAGTSVAGTQLSADQSLAAGMFFGLKGNIGMVVTPKIAIKLIAEGTYGSYTLGFKDDADAAKTSSFWALGGSAGLGLDFAVTDKIIIGVGARYKFAPTTFTSAVADNKDLFASSTKIFVDSTKDQTQTLSGGYPLEFFVEAAFRITQN